MVRAPGVSLTPWLLCVLAGLLVPAATATSFTNPVSEFVACDWPAENDVPHDSINAVIPTGEGYFWLATRAGLIRFDGVRFVTVGPPLIPGRRQRSFTSLCEAHDGTLWVASEDGQLRGLKNGAMRQLLLPAEATHGVLTKVFQSGEGSLWVGTETNGLVRFRHGNTTRFTVADGLAHNSIRSLCEDPAGNVWIATAAGVNRWRDGQFTTLTVQDGLLHNSIRVVYADRRTNLWIASHFGLTRLTDGQMTHYRKREGLADNLITAMFEDRQGVLWIGTFNGLNRMVDGRLHAEARADGTSYDRVHSIFEDHEGNLWIANRDGLSRLKPRVVTAYTQQHGLTHNDATAVLEEPGGELWVTFWGGGINKVHEGTITPYGRREGLSSELVLTLHRSHNGDMWFGMDYDGGMNQFNGTSFVHYRELEGLKDHAVRAIQHDRQGNLWVGTRTALLEFKAGRFHRHTVREGLPSNTIGALHQDRSGRLWVGTAGGLAMRQAGRFIAFTTKDGLPHNLINAIYEDQEGILWLGTRGGLGRVSDGRFTAFTANEGLARNDILAVTEDSLGYLWMSSRSGIIRVSKLELKQHIHGISDRIACISFGKVDGMASVECKGTGNTAAWRGKDGRLWFPTSKGVVAINPHTVRTTTQPPTVVIEELRVNQQPVALSSSVQFVAQKQEFVFRYTAFSFSAPEKLTFKYKLEGLDNNWIDAGNAREARYNHLPPGDYHFRVIAENGDGLRNREGSSLALILKPPYWQTWWFRCSLAVLALGAVAGGVRYISIQKLQRQLAALEQQHAVEKERTRIAQDMHDDLGANLTQICILSELAKREANQPKRVGMHVDAISDTARELVQSMDEIVWSANPQNDNLRRLSGYIFQYAENFLAPTQIRGRFDRPASLPDHPLNAELRHNLFLVVKEALNNVVKHSRAGEVRLRIKFTGACLEISIEDNGRGFVTDAGRPFGNGLLNMKQRIADVGGRLELHSGAGTGTDIRVTVELAATP